MTKKQWKIIFAILLAGSALAALKMIFFDYTMDEEYQMMMGYRVLRGDHLFREMWEPHQTSAFLCTGLMWLYKTVTGTYTGILLYLRVCTTGIQIALCWYLYRVLRLLLDRNVSLLCAIIYFNMVPKVIQIPEFSNMQVWFFTLTVLSLMHYYLLRDRSHRDRAYLVFVSGVCMAMEVLAYPSCVILFPFFVGYLYKSSGPKKGRDILLFAGACAACAIIWLGIILVHVDIGELLRNVRLLLSYDLTHEISGATTGKLRGIAAGLLGGAGFVALALLISAPALAIIRRKYKDMERQKVLPILLTVVIFVSECIQWYLWTVRKSGYEIYQLHLLFVLLAGLAAWRSAGLRKKYFTAGIIGTLLSYIGVIYISDLEMFFALPHGTLGVLMCAIVLALALEESLGEAAGRWICFLLVGLCLVSIWGKGYTLRGGRNYNVIVDTENIMKCGPAVGIFSDYMNCYIYNCNYEDFRTYVEEGDVVLIVANMVDSAGTTPYMMAGAEVAHYSIVDPTAYDERLLAYWELYPQKRPNVIVTDCWYGDSKEDPDSWIMQYIEKEFGYSRVDDGRYVRFYRK